MHQKTPYGAGAYRAVGIETGVDATDPLGLVIMLYDGAIQAIFNAEHRLSIGEIEARGRYTSRAISIVNQGLVASLDRKVGGDLAESLAALYDYISRLLFNANLKGDANIYAEARTLLCELRESWNTLRRSRSVAPVRGFEASLHNGLAAYDRVLPMGRSLAA